MGAIISRFSRVGSETFYASYERNFERLKTDTAKLKVRPDGHSLLGHLIASARSFHTGPQVLQCESKHYCVLTPHFSAHLMAHFHCELWQSIRRGARNGAEPSPESNGPNLHDLRRVLQRLQEQQLERRRRRDKLTATIFWYSAAAWAAMAAYAAWVWPCFYPETISLLVRDVNGART